MEQEPIISGIDEDDSHIDYDQIEPKSNEIKTAKFRITVEPTIGIMFLTQALTDSVLTELYLKRTCQVMLEYNSTICNALGSNTEEGHAAEALVQPAAAELLMCKTLLASTVPAFLSLFLGPWSDTNGRKPVIVFSVTGSTLTFCVYVVLSNIPNLHPAFLLIGALPLACVGGYVNIISICFCYIGDISTSNNRSFRLAVLEGCLLVGSLVGLLVSPYIFAAAEVFGLGYLTIFGISALLCLLVLIQLVLFVEDSVNVAQGAVGFAGLFDFSLPITTARACLKARKKGRRAIIFLCIFCLAISVIILEGETAVAFLFYRLQFRWSLRQYMNFNSVSMAGIIAGTVFSSLVLIRYLKMKDTTLAKFTFLASTVNSVLTGIASIDRIYLLYTSAAVRVFRELIGPLLRAIVSKSVPANELGKVFALAASIEAMMPLAAAPAYVNLYNYFIPEFPGAPFILSAILFATCIAAVGVIEFIQKSYASSNLDENDEGAYEDVEENRER